MGLEINQVVRDQNERGRTGMDRGGQEEWARLARAGQTFT